MRLDKLVSTLGLASRGEAGRMIRQGRVAVAGQVCRDPAQAVTPGAMLAVDGLAVSSAVERHVMLHKPAGLLTAARDSKQPTVMDLLPPLYAACGCMPVGRLDKDTTGLLLLTTDGEMNHRLLSPKRHVDKTYQARVAGRLTAKDVEAFAAGLFLGDFTARPARLAISAAGEGESLALVTLGEGKFHQVKRMFEAVGHPVLALHRLTFGSLALDPALAPGQWRELTAAEVASLRRDALGREEDHGGAIL